ncbi:hypothetical protein, partial [Pectobacterium carotovorum]|uniref:hypothetical protein n=1 Tax=Pectobacterium carotovorum TaxID=554 RepID=UPI001BE40BE5
MAFIVTLVAAFKLPDDICLQRLADLPRFLITLPSFQAMEEYKYRVVTRRRQSQTTLHSYDFGSVTTRRRFSQV